MTIPLFIFICVILIGFGYVAGNARNFNLFKFILLASILFPFFSTLNVSKDHIITMSMAFLVGYLLTYANLLSFIGDELSNFINAIRYRDAYEDIKRKEAEVEELRKKYERYQKAENARKREEEYQKRKKQSQEYRQQQRANQQENTSSSGKSDKSTSSNSYQHTSRNSTRNNYLEILGLNPSGSYSHNDIKKAYRKQANKYHPDKHYSKGEETVKEMSKKFKEINSAYEWLALSSDK
jgi:curved DNA-binding protein CbpA